MKHKKTIIISVIVLAISFILIALFNSTYALFSNDDYANRPDVYSTGLLQIETTSKSENISLTNALPMSDEDGVLSEPYIFTIKNVGNLDYKFDIKLLSIGSGNSFLPQYVKIQVDNGEVVSLNQLSSSNIKEDITLKVGQSIDVSIRVWLSIDTPNTELGKSFNCKIVTDGQAVYTESNYSVTTLTEYISNLYYEDEKKIVNHNNIGYSYGTSSNLMNDKLGGTIEHDGGNIRYYGKTPNNYIYFNCDDYSNQTDSTCEKWRIIGVFDGKVKIVRAQDIGEYVWDYNSDGTYNNDWTESGLMDLLNNGYYTNSNSFKFYNGSKTASTINFVSKGVGIKNDVTRNLISENTWSLGAFATPAVYVDSVYNDERSNNICSVCTKTTWDGKVGLMYSSDYGYAADLSQCNQLLNGYSNCTSVNWLYNNNNNNKGFWLITSYLSNTMSSKFITSDGNVGSGYRVYNPTGSVVYPTVFLDKNVIKIYGNGTSSNPYRISDSESYRSSYKGNAAEYITNLYLGNKDKVVTNNSIEYQYSTAVNLMNDRLGGTTDDYDDGNVRYYGANPNNYVYFNCDDYGNQTDSTCEKWRIIGVFDGKVKLVRDNSLGDFDWSVFESEDNTLSKNINNWHDSSLKDLLNGAYYNNENSKYYISEKLFEGYEDTALGYNWKFTNTDINFRTENIGIKNSKTRELIYLNEWYLGGFNVSDTNIYSSDLFQLERGDAIGTNTYKIWSGNIALIYMSDYMYASDFSICNVSLSGYNSKNCKTNDWLFFQKDYWSIVPASNNVNSVKFISYDGSCNDGGFSDDPYAVYPSLYLNSNVNIMSGMGTSDNPYVLG